ncbi:DUF5708 family protein [Streptomyces sp. MST-110588]|uniref:DUF5708 family protein n=1 Tax=Streptomyces sp. MST-110588 TaxID=2833628 RepID=UPI001F5DB059|nr:DUF5708 family protein [Streptomyces sp. MST-110588]UNO42399.1 hypothetical protein KGS77_26355 [Streptomyces sp. MST-110588]
MSNVTKTGPAAGKIFAGAVVLAVGLVMWLVFGGHDLGIVETTKAGIVISCIGGAELLYGVYRSLPGGGKD